MIWNRIKRPDPEKEEEFREQMKEVKLSWKDKFAMVISAYAVLLVPALLVVGGICLLACWLFGLL